jgi:carboxyl-terminal processing protease
VYGGGGITPDDKIDTPKANHIQDVLDAHNVFFNFTKHYLANRDVTRDFQVDDAVLADFKQFLTAQNISYTDADLNGVMDWLKTNIKASIFTTQFGQLQGLRIKANWDPMIAQALTYMPQAQALEQGAEKAAQAKQTARNAAPSTE